MKTDKLQKLARFIRYYILKSSTAAGSGHPTSSLSATDLMTVLFFHGFFHFDFKNPDNLNNDRLIFSKGHATPLYYSLFLAAGVLTPKQLLDLRKFSSPLEGHPTPRFKYTEAATGSLGQGLSVGVGMALGLRALTPKLPKSPRSLKEGKFMERLSRVYVLLGDGETAEGAVWEAANLASYYKLDNLVAVVDVNRLGQSQETMFGWDTKKYQERFEAFGWDTIVIDGHDIGEIAGAFHQIQKSKIKNQNSGKYFNNKPTAIIAKTVKGKGISFLENKEGWHGKPLKIDELEKALKELGEIDLSVRGEVGKPKSKFQNPNFKKNPNFKIQNLNYKLGEEVATRKAYGKALERLGATYPNIVSLDGDVKNSTYAEIFKKKFPERFFEMFIAEQNMVGVGVGMARLGFIPFASSFACFLTRGFDQIRMAALSAANVKFCGSHAGVSIGQDGPSQMGLEDLAMFRSVQGSVVLYPSDAVSTEKLVEEMVKHKGISYIRTSRPATPVIYRNDEEFKIGGCKVHRLTPDVILSKAKNPATGLRSRIRERSLDYARYQSVSGSARDDKKKIIIIAAGITLFEALKAQRELAKEGKEVTVVDCYSIKPIDSQTLKKLVSSITNHQLPITNIITVEDHWFDGGLGDAVLNVFSNEPKVKVHKLAVSQMPRSAKPEELLAYEGIDSASIISKITSLF